MNNKVNIYITASPNRTEQLQQRLEQEFPGVLTIFPEALHTAIYDTDIELSRYYNNRLQRADIYIVDISQQLLPIEVLAKIGYVSGWTKAWRASTDYIQNVYGSVPRDFRTRILGVDDCTIAINSHVKGMIEDVGRYIQASPDRWEEEVVKDVRAWIQQNYPKLYKRVLCRREGRK